MRIAKLILFAEIWALAGCSSSYRSVDRRQMEVRKDLEAGINKVADQAEDFGGAYLEVEDSRKVLDDDRVNKVWRRFIESHTDAAGNLRATSQPGDDRPMQAVVLLREMDDHEAAIRENEKIHLVRMRPYTTFMTKTVPALRAMVKDWWAEEQKIDAQKDSEEAIIKNIIDGLKIGGGIGMGMLLASGGL